MSHTLVSQNMRRKGTFEKLFLEGRPPVNLGVTSGGDLFGGTQVTFTDVLGDKQFSMFAASVSQYRTMSFSYVNLSRRLHYALQAYSQTQFYYGMNNYGVFYDPQYAYIDRDQAIATQTARGATAFGIYPLNRYARLEFSTGLMQFSQEYNEPGLQEVADEYQQQRYGRTLFSNGTFMPLGVTYVQETTIFREYGPLAGNTVRLGYEYAPSWGGLLSRQTADLDARYYLRLATNGVLAFRARGFKSWGEFPDYLYFGGNSEMRGYDYLEFLGNKAFFLNSELRFPLIEAALTPIGVIGGLRGIAFAIPMQVWTKDPITITPLLGFEPNFTTLQYDPIYGDPATIGGFKLVDGRASYGIGLETFALGFPIHFDWSWRTLFNSQWEDYVFAYQGISEGTTGSKWFRKPRFSMWIGYDF
jgi:hypothetical protein